jgi:uncharacterized membrane protein
VKWGWLRHGVIAVAIVIYALLEHHTNTTGGSSALGAALAIAPLLLALVLMARRTPTPKLTLLLTCLLGAVLVKLYWHQIERNFPLMYLLQEVGVYAVLAFGFGRSLMAGQVPLCTHWASVLHGTLSEPVRRYTRGVTLAWTLFFIAISLTSALIYLLAPLRVWSFFSNFMTLPLAALMFGVEYELRRRRLPWMQRANLADTARAYFATMRTGPAPRY